MAALIEEVNFQETLTILLKTHCHGDHCFDLLEMYTPELQRLATTGDVKHVDKSMLKRTQFPVPLGRPIRLVHGLDKNNGPELEGHEMLSIEAGHARIDDSTFLQVRDLSLVVIGDVSHNDMHLASREPDERNARSLDYCTRNDRGIEACCCHPITDSLG